MDEVDRKILYYLDIDSRRPAKQIAGFMGEKSEKVTYRLNRLFKDNVIDRCFAEVNPWKVGFTSFKVYIQFQGVDREKIDEMYSFLSEKCNVNWAASCLGRWDMIVEILARDRHEFREIYSKFHSKYCQDVLYKVIGVTLELIFINKKWLWPENKGISMSDMTGQPKKLVDDKDVRILRQLITNCRKPVRKIAEELDIPQTTVLQRIGNMREKGVITNFRTGIFISKLNRVLCKAFIYFSNPTPEEEKQLTDYCIHHPDVVFVCKTIAPWEMEIDVHAVSFNDFTAMMNDMRNRFPNVVRNFEAVVINKGTGSFHTLPL